MKPPPIGNFSPVCLVLSLVAIKTKPPAPVLLLVIGF